jgi:hypothetical protein
VAKYDQMFLPKSMPICSSCLGSIFYPNQCQSALPV